jgi:drug/metabolite transporter (DMT)-like permease
VTQQAGRTQVWAALATVYVLWGSTYLGILYAIRTFPPFLMLGARFAIAGLLLFAFSVRRGDRAGDRPGWRQWRAAAIVGGALLLVGNGGITWAEKRVSTGVASLVVATVPLWMALFDRMANGQRLSPRATAGLVVGLAGAAILANPFGAGHVDLLGAGLLILSAVSWAGGSIYARRAPLPKRPLVGASMEMIVAGLGFTLMGLVTGETGRAGHISGGSLAALAYLIVFGSLVGYTAYIWLLGNAPTSLVSTYAYVNPAVAVLLGWLFVNETIGPRMVVAGAMIIGAVVLIVAKPKPRERPVKERLRGALPARAR